MGGRLWPRPKKAPFKKYACVEEPAKNTSGPEQVVFPFLGAQGDSTAEPDGNSGEDKFPGNKSIFGNRANWEFKTILQGDQIVGFGLFI